MRVGQSIKLRFIGTGNNFIHPMHVHGGPFEVVARDGVTLPSSGRYLADTINVGPGPRSDRALDILRERYARGEIDKDEFEAKQRDLR